MLGSIPLFGNKKKRPSFAKLFTNTLKILFITERPKIFFRSKEPGHTLHSRARDLYNVRMYKRKKKNGIYSYKTNATITDSKYFGLKCQMIFGSFIYAIPYIHILCDYVPEHQK